jgi:hypothetical protein
MRRRIENHVEDILNDVVSMLATSTILKPGEGAYVHKKTLLHTLHTNCWTFSWFDDKL